MPLRQTEAHHKGSESLDMRPDGEILALLLDGQQRALATLGPALSDIADGAALMAAAVTFGGRLIYAAAGSSGLMALADASELGGTFGINPGKIQILMAGGLPVDAHMPGNTEDDTEEAVAAAGNVHNGDVVIALSASGNTPYPMTIARCAQSAGAKIICIANNPHAAMFEYADVAICLATPPEVIAGSTRLGAGTAQKAALNLMSSLMGIRLGHVFDGMMVNVVADNAKLRDRAAGIVARISGVEDALARDCLEKTGGAVKPAVLLAAGASPERAGELLKDTKGHLRAALARV